MKQLTIQLTFDFDLTIDGLYSAIELLEYTVCKGQAVASLRVYNQILSALAYCRENDIFAPSDLSSLFVRLVSFHRDVLTLNKVY